MAGVAVGLICLTVRFLSMDRPVVRSFRAHWSINGEVPWGTTERDKDGGFTVVVWHPVQGGYCYDAVFSKDLRNRLANLHAATVDVDYNLFSNFGRPRRHTVKSVDGISVDARSNQESGMMEEPNQDRSGPIRTDCESWLANNE